MRVRAPVRTPAGQQHLDGPNQVPPTASEDELKDWGLVSGEDLLEDLQRRPVGSEAKRQVDGAAEAFNEHVLLRRADGILLGTLGFGLLLAAVGLRVAVAALLRAGGGFRWLRSVTGVWFGLFRRADRVLLPLAGAPPVFAP